MKTYLGYTALSLTAVLLVFLIACGGSSNSIAPDKGLAFYQNSQKVSSLNFSYTINEPALPAEQSLVVASTSGSPIDYSATTDVSNPNWLSVQPSNGTALPSDSTTPSAITITALPRNLGKGKYTGHVIVVGPNNSRATATVTLTVASTTDPMLDVTPTSLSFTATHGGSDPEPQLFSVKNDNPNSDPVQLQFTLTTDSPWLTATSPVNVATTSVTVQPKVASLAPGTYTGKVTVTSTGALNSPATVNVTFTVQ